MRNIKKIIKLMLIQHKKGQQITKIGNKQTFTNRKGRTKCEKDGQKAI